MPQIFLTQKLASRFNIPQKLCHHLEVQVHIYPLKCFMKSFHFFHRIGAYYCLFFSFTGNKRLLYHEQ